MVAVIYIILNLINGKFYVGQSLDAASREDSHLNALEGNYHANQHLQRAFKKYGRDVFRFEILEVVEDVSKLDECEQYWLDKLQAVDEGYNICRIAGSTRGLKHPKESFQKHSDATKRMWSEGKLNPPTEASNIKRSLKLKGRVKSESERINWSQSRMGHIVTEETRKKISVSNTGYRHTEEDLKKISVAAKAQWSRKKGIKA